MTDDNVISLEERERRHFEKHCKMQGLPSSEERQETLEGWIRDSLRASEYVLREKAEAELPIISGMMEFALSMGSLTGRSFTDKKLAAKLLDQSAEMHDIAKRLMDAAHREEAVS